jgi:hypothetical protein
MDLRIPHRKSLLITFYDEALPFGKYSVFNPPQNFFAFRKKDTWYYFDRFGKLILKSKTRVDRLSKNPGNILGTVKDNDKFKLLFADGSLSNFQLDSISEDVNIGFKENEIFFLNDNKTLTKYIANIKNMNFSKISKTVTSPYGGWRVVEITETITTVRTSPNNIIKKTTDPNLWKSLNDNFDFCDYINLKEAGNRHVVDGLNIIMRTDIDGMTFPKQNPHFNENSEEINNFLGKLNNL